MTEGQREGEVEVLEINETEGTVKVNEYGSVTVLNLEKPPNSPAPGPVAAAGAPPFPGFAPPAPAGAAIGQDVMFLKLRRPRYGAVSKPESVASEPCLICRRP